MKISSAELHFLKIPFRLSITHGARADRTFSDSVVLTIRSGGFAGFGEAIFRDYVSGPLDRGTGLQMNAARQALKFLSPIREIDLSWSEVTGALSRITCDSAELPMLCAVETALLDLSCALEARDAYSLLGSAPLRDTVSYGGAIPMLPLAQAPSFVERYIHVGFPNLKVKVGADPVYNEGMLSLCRQMAGPRFDIRVDANASWDTRDAELHLSTCSRHGVRVIEQPFSAPPGWSKSITNPRTLQGFRFVADEGFLTADDVARIASAGDFQVLNLRLSKNGGLSRVLALAREAEANGLAYQIGCMVGETGILSALGRVAASLLPRALYLEGSYDDVLLSDNITTRSFGFGPGGKGSIVRGERIGFEVSEEKLRTLSVASVSCF